MNVYYTYIYIIHYIYQLEHKVNKLLEAQGEDQSIIEDLREELHKAC